MAPQRTIHEADAALDNDYGRLNLGRSLGASSAKVDLDCSGTCLFRTSARILLPTKLAQALIQTPAKMAVVSYDSTRIDRINKDVPRRLGLLEARQFVNDVVAPSLRHHSNLVSKRHLRDVQLGTGSGNDQLDVSFIDILVLQEPIPIEGHGTLNVYIPADLEEIQEPNH